MHEQVQRQPRANGRAWAGAVLGIVALVQVPLLIVLGLLEPESGFSEPLHTLMHEGALVFLLAGLRLRAAALVVAVLTLRRGRTNCLGYGLTMTGLVTGVIAVLRSTVPAVGGLFWLLGQG